VLLLHDGEDRLACRLEQDKNMASSGTAQLVGIVSRRGIMNLFHLRLDLER
jgi:hypothetical protein